MRRHDWILAFALAVLLALSACAHAWAEDEEISPYVENQWNFVDGSIDVTGSIPEDAEGTLAQIRRRGVLRVATEPYFPPQEFIDPGLSGQVKYLGSDMALARTIARYMNVDLVIVPMDFTEVLNAVRDGECDLAISALSFTPGRASMVEMSKGYYFSEDGAGSILVIRAADAEAITTLDDLSGRDVAAQSGSLQELLMAENVTNYHEFRRLSQVQDVFDALEEGSTDAAIVDIDSAESYLRNNPDCGLALVTGVSFQMQSEFEGDRVAGKKGDLQLMYFVNGVIDLVNATDQYNIWYRQYEAKAAELGY